MPLPIMRASQIPENRPKDLDFQEFNYQVELEYPQLMSWRRLLDSLISLPENMTWNSVLCLFTLLAILILSLDYVSSEVIFGVPVTQVTDIAYNVMYVLYVVADMLNDCYRYHHEQHHFSWKYWLWYVLDGATYLHYVTLFLPRKDIDINFVVKMACYYVRLRRALVLLFRLNDYYLKGSVVGCLFKYWYIFVMVRVISSNAYAWLGLTKDIKYKYLPDMMNKSRAKMFYQSFYVLDKRFFPIGIDRTPESDLDRVISLVVVMLGALLVSGVSVAGLALIISVRMKSEYKFRARFCLIINDLKENNVPIPLYEKVESFYKIYWHKQKAVSVTRLLPTYPPNLICTLYTDIYFEALQKSQILRDLSYQFLSELAKHMRTINFVQGDVIIKRNSNKYAVVYISYGDVEMVTAEDDDTPILRFTRGTILNPCGACVDVASSTAHVSVRAATFCTAHVLRTADLWRVAVKHRHLNGQTYIIHSAFEEHLDKVVRHYAKRPHPPVKHKTTTLQLKRNLIELKEARDENGKLLISRTDVFLQIANCYIMRNQADVTSLTEESDAICLRSTFPCILQPTSDLQILWKIFVVVITLVVTVVHTYYIVYAQTAPNNFVFFNTIVTVIYILDIIIHLSTGATTEEGEPLSFLQTSSRQVRSVWFVLDVVAVMPIFEFIGNGQFTGMNKLCKLVYVFRTLKLLEDTWVFHSNTIRFFSFCLLMFVLSWLVAALDHGFLCFNLNFCRIFNFLDHDVWEINKTATTPDEIADLLSYSIFWAVSFTTFTSHPTAGGTMRHFGTQAQVMFILEVCGLLFIFVQAAYAATIIVTEQLRNKYHTCIDTVQQFLEKNEVDAEVRYRFINYLQLCWYTDKAYRVTHEKSSILFDLPKHVYHDISAIQRNKYLLCIPFMKELPEAMLKSISATAHLFYISPNEILLNTGDISNEIYVIKQGFCEVLDTDTKKVVSILTANQHFGDIECLMRLPAYYTVRAVTHVQLFTVARKNINTAITSQKIRDAILYAKKQPEYHELVRHRREQFLRYEKPPPPSNRMKFRKPRKHETDAAFLQPFRHLGFFSVFKYVFPRFTIRPDGPYLRRHEWFRAICAFCSAIVIPSFYLLSMQFPWVYYIVWFLDLTAYFDVVQRMLVGYFNEKGILVYHPASTTAHYIKGALIVDLLGCLPLENLDNIVIYLYSSNEYTIVSTTMEVLLFNRCLQLYRLPAVLRFLDDYFYRRDNNILYSIKVVPLFMVMISIVGMLIAIHSVKMIRYHNGGWKLIPRSPRFTSWILFNGTNVGYNITKTPFNLWLTTYYWATSQLTSTGFGIFIPHSQFLLVLFILSMLFATIVSMYLSVRLLSMRSNVNQALATFQHNMKDMIIFMKREKFPRKLQREVQSYYEYTWEKTGGTEYRSVFKLCDQITLRTDAILHIYGETFYQCSILYKCDTSLLRLLGRAMHSVYFRRDMTVIERNDVISKLYIIDYGTVQARDPIDDDVVNAILPRGSLFGNLNNVTREVSPSSFTVDSNAHLLEIDAWLFYKILKDFPVTKERLVRYRQKDENYVIGRDSKTSTQKHKNSRAIDIQSSSWFLKHFLSHSKFMIVYLIITCLLCIMLDVYNAGFQCNFPPIIYTLYALDLAFIPKIVMALLFPHVSEQRSGSKSAIKTARKKYILGEFKYDIASLLPLELFCLCFRKPWSAFAYFRLNRYLRVVTLHCCIQRYRKKLTTDLTCPTIIALVIRFSLFIHTITCLWHLLATYQDKRKFKSSWRWHRPVGPLNNDNDTVCDPHHTEYICSAYFIIITIMRSGGVHDVLARQQIEVIFICMVMLLSIMMYMIMVGEFARIIHYRSYRCFSFYAEYLELQEFLKNNRVSHNLVAQTKKYTLHLWREARGLQSPHFVDAAPNCLRLKVMSAAYMKHLKGTTIFKHCEPAFLRHLVGYLQPYYYEGNMFVVREGEITNSMYFIHKGRVQEITEDTNEKSRVFNVGTCFGTVTGLYRDVAFTNSYKTEIKSQVLTLSLDSWEYLLKHFPGNTVHIYRNMKDPKIGNKFQTMKPTKVRVFPPKSMMALNQEIPKDTDSADDKDKPKLEISSDEISQQTQQLIKEIREKIKTIEASETSVSEKAKAEPRLSGKKNINAAAKPTATKRRLQLEEEDIQEDPALIESLTEVPILQNIDAKRRSVTEIQPSTLHPKVRLTSKNDEELKRDENSKLSVTQSIRKKIFTSAGKLASPKRKVHLPLKHEPQSAQDMPQIKNPFTEEPISESLAADSQLSESKYFAEAALPTTAEHDKPKIIEPLKLKEILESSGTQLELPRESPIDEIVQEKNILIPAKQKLYEYKTDQQPTSPHVKDTQSLEATESFSQSAIAPTSAAVKTQSLRQLSNNSDKLNEVPMSAYKMRRSAIFGLDKKTVNKEFSQDQQSTLIPKGDQRTRSSLEEIKLAKTSYDKEVNETTVKESEHNIKYQDKVEKDNLWLEQNEATTSALIQKPREEKPVAELDLVSSSQDELKKSKNAKK